MWFQMMSMGKFGSFLSVGGIHVVPDDVYGEVWVILVSAIHVGVMEMSL